MYPAKPTGDNAISESYIFALNDADKEPMSSSEILGGYTNKGESPSPLSSIPDANKFNSLIYQMHNSLVWVIKYIEELFTVKLEKSGGTMAGTLAMGTNKVTTTYVPSADIDLANKLYVDTAINGAWILTEIKELAYPSLPTLPIGMEVCVCDGRALSRTTYSALFSIMGITHGAGDGSTTFNIPDKRGVFTRGWDNGRGLDPGRTFGSYQASGVPNIKGNFWTSGLAVGYDGAFAPGPGAPWHVGGSIDGGNNYINLDASRSSTEYKNDISEVRVKSTTGYFVIRIK